MHKTLDTRLFEFDIFLCIFVTHSVFMGDTVSAAQMAQGRPGARTDGQDIHCCAALLCLSADKFEDQSN